MGYTFFVTGPPAVEYRALREAVTHRTHLRSSLALGGIVAWAALLVATLVTLPYPVASLIPLLVLVATFEVIRPLHAGAERIGRYLQVFVEEAAEAPGDDTAAPRGGLHAPAWERTAMAFGPAVPGAAGHPLFVPLFAMATAVNLLAVLLPSPLAVEWAVLAVPHGAFVGWLWRADRGMRQQRSAELARYRALRDGTE
jgi:hypothetical protein